MKSILNNSHILLILIMLGIALPVTTTAAQSDAYECTVDSLAPDSSNEEFLFRFNGKQYTVENLSIDLQQAMFDAKLQHYKDKLAFIDTALFKLETKRRADTAGETHQEYLDDLFTVETPDDDAIRQFYEANRTRIPYPLNDSVTNQIRELLIQQEMQRQRIAFVNEIKKTNDFDILLERPEAPFADINSDGFPSKGPDNAKITVVEFADYQCPHCKTAAPVMKRLVEQYPNDVRIVYMDFPINPSGVSRLIAKGAACADKQGRFWEYHDAAFARQEQLDKYSPAAIAQDLELDSTAFQNCMDSSFPESRVSQSETEASRLGLNSTPTLFVNGRRLHTHDIESDLINEIESILSDSAE